MESTCETDIFGMFLSLLLAVVPVNKYRNVFLRFIRPFCSQVVCLSVFASFESNATIPALMPHFWAIGVPNTSVKWSHLDDLDHVTLPS